MIEKKRQKKGTGTFRKRANGTIEYRVFIETQLGLSSQKSFYGKTEKECRQKFKAWSNNPEKLTIKNSITVEQWADKWLKIYKKGKVSDGTYYNYEMYVGNHIKKELGKYNLTEVRPAHIQQFYSTIINLSESAQNHIYIALKGIFSTAIENKKLTENPVKCKPKSPRCKESNIKLFSPEDIVKIISSQHEFAYIPQLLLFTGIRTGEALALKWNNYNDTEGYLIIDESMSRNRSKEKGVLKREKVTKSGKSRKISLTHEATNLLNKIPKESAYIFIHEKNKIPLTPREFEIRYRKVFDDIKIPYLSPHKCRHTYATYLIKGGAELKAVQALLGHASVQVTEIYTHVANDLDHLKSNTAKLKYC